MTRQLYLSRARLRHDAPMSALREALSPMAGTRTTAAHRLIWTLFGDEADRRRDFLWREADPGVFYLLSERLPEDRTGLFHLDPPKPFAPSLEPGDRIRFVLRANATVARKRDGEGFGIRGQRCDVVMDAIRDLPPGERARQRQEVLPVVATQWLKSQGKRHGFEVAHRTCAQPGDPSRPAGSGLDGVDVLGYRVLRLGRGRGSRPMQLGVLDMQGTLVVNDPVRILSALAGGFGRAKAFGCGLMLIRRAR